MCNLFYTNTKLLNYCLTIFLKYLISLHRNCSAFFFINNASEIYTFNIISKLIFFNLRFFNLIFFLNTIDSLHNIIYVRLLLLLLLSSLSEKSYIQQVYIVLLKILILLHRSFHSYYTFITISTKYLLLPTISYFVVSLIILSRFFYLCYLFIFNFIPYPMSHFSQSLTSIAIILSF